jgi:hypothetical protein
MRLVLAHRQYSRYLHAQLETPDLSRNRRSKVVLHIDGNGVYQAVPTHWLFQFAAVSNYQGQNEDMRTLTETIVAIAILGCWSCFGASNIMAQTHPSTSELVKRLQSPKNTDDARKQLLQLGNSDPDVRRYLAVHLPPMIEIGPKSCPPSDIEDLNTRWHACPWYNAVELSGKLRIAEAVTALAPWIGWRVDGPSCLLWRRNSYSIQQRKRWRRSETQLSRFFSKCLALASHGSTPWLCGYCA